MSENRFFFCHFPGFKSNSKPKDTQFTVILDKEKQKIFTSEKQEPVNFFQNNNLFLND